MYDALRNVALFVQFNKREKHPWRNDMALMNALRSPKLVLQDFTVNIFCSFKLIFFLLLFKLRETNLDKNSFEF